MDIESAIAALPPALAEQYAIVFRHGTFEAGIYAPRIIDDQAPHTRDEAYVVLKGSGHFCRALPAQLWTLPRVKPRYL